jgi:hypothetical protein
MATKRHTNLLASTVALLAIFAVTLWPLSGPAHRGFSACLTCGEGVAGDAVLNILLFIPLGAAMARHRSGIRGAVAASFAISLLVEVLQWWGVPGREATATDVLTNTIGGGVGAVLMANRRLLASPTTSEALLLVCAGGTLWTMIIGIATWGLAPDAPATRQYWGQHAHDLPGFTVLDARVIRSRINGYELPDAPIPTTNSLRESIQSEGYRIEALVSGLPSVGGRAEITALVDGENHFLALLEQRQCILRFSARMRGARIGLVPPSVGLADACAEGVTRVNGSLDRERMTVSLEHDGVLRSHSRRTTPGTGWSLIVPDALPDSVEWAWTLAWLGVPIALMGWWARRTGFNPWPRWIALSAWGCVVLVAAATVGEVALPTSTDCAIVSFAAAGTLVPTKRSGGRNR